MDSEVAPRSASHGGGGVGSSTMGSCSEVPLIGSARLAAATSWRSWGTDMTVSVSPRAPSEPSSAAVTNGEPTTNRTSTNMVALSHTAVCSPTPWSKYGFTASAASTSSPPLAAESTARY